MSQERSEETPQEKPHKPFEPYPPRKPPQMSALFVVVWVIGLLALVVLGGCTVLLVTVGFSDLGALDIGVLAGIVVMLGALYGFGRALLQGRRSERAQQPPSTVFLYTLLIPVVTAFVWAGGCLLMLR